MDMPMPLANQFGAGLQRNCRRGSPPASLVRAFAQQAQHSLGAEAEPAMGMFLNPVGDPTEQQITAQPGWRRGSVQSAPFDPQISGRQRFESCDLGFNISCLGPTAGSERQAAGEPASFLASFGGWVDRCHLPASAMR